MTDRHADRDVNSPKEASSNDTCRCSIDPRERHIVSKLDRYELEDRYLRILGELHTLKKLSNNQEDKIKRLATKLMRYGADPRTCIATVDVGSDRERLSLLEAENSKLRNKMCILRNQLTNTRIFTREPLRARRIGSSTGLNEGSRLKATSCQCVSERAGNEEDDARNYSLKIQEMQNERKELTSRIADLEAELVSFSSGNRREKVAENVEYIRVWRQMQRQNEKLVSVQATNEILNEQIFQLKSRLEECTKSNVQLNSGLEAERLLVAQLEDKLSTFKDSEVDNRVKDERLMDLKKEMEILQQHNTELLGLSSKFSKVEKANNDYKRRIAEQATEVQSLKDKLSKEKANMSAVTAANDQLLLKVNDLQRSIDLMSIKLMEQKEKRSSIIKKKNGKKKLSAVSFSQEQLYVSDDSSSVNSETYTKHSNGVKSKNLNDVKTKDSNSVVIKSSNGMRTKKLNGIKSKNSDEENIKNSNHPNIMKPDKSEKSIQAGEMSHLVNEMTQTLDSAKLNEKTYIDFTESDNKSSIYLGRNGSSLSRERILKLLDEAEIKVPADSQSTSRINNSESTLRPTSSRQVTNIESLLFGDPKV